MSSLATKIDQLKDDHADEEFNKLKTYHEQHSVEEAIFILGRIKQNDHIGAAIASNLSTQSILALQRFQQEKKYEALGFDNFDQFLNESPYSPMKKTQYYDRLQILKKHGPDVDDLLTAIGIPMRSQKLLEKGDVEIRNDRIYVGDKEIDGANTGILKDVLTELFDERRQLLADKEKLDSKLESQKDQLAKGRDEFEQLQRNFDAYRENSPYANAVMNLVGAVSKLTKEIAELSAEQRAKFAGADMPIFGDQWFRLCDAYGVPSSRYERVSANGNGKPAETTKDAIMDRAIEMIDQEGFEDLN
jgi:methyl-accepting chemotaxis protein